jgi:hypothetical protein
MSAYDPKRTFRPTSKEPFPGAARIASDPVATNMVTDTLRIGLMEDVTMVGANEVQRFIAITLASGILAFAASGTAFAQAGSTGGSVGKTDKSISGGEETPAPHRNTPSAKPAPASPSPQSTQTANRCAAIVGTWNWPNGSEIAFYKDGTAGTAGQPPGGTWRCSGGTVIATFSNGGRDEYIVSPDGSSLSLTTNWLPGRFTATRKN